MSNSILLLFLDSWESQHAKDVQPGLYSAVFKPGQDESQALELLRELDRLRRVACVHTGGNRTAATDEIAETLGSYVDETSVLLARMDEASMASFSTSWTSPLAGRPTYHYKLKGLLQEQSMAAFLFASCLRAQALQRLAPPATPEPNAADAGDKDAGPLVSAVALLRRAAGVFNWLSVWGLPRVAMKLAADRPAELLMSMSQVMELVCLAEAQALTAHRAGQRRSRAGLVCSLWVGSWDLWEQAARTLKDHTSDFNTVSERLRRFLAISGSLARARALKWLGEDCRNNKQQAGQGEAACMHAATVLKSCLAAVEGDLPWRTVLTAESASLEVVRLQCEKDRQTVYYQNIATAFPDLPAPNVLVKPQPYAPAEGQGQGQGSPSGHAAPDGPDGGDGALVSPGSGSGSGNNSLRRDASNVSAGNAAAALADLSLDNSLTLRRSVKK